jgi:hypothetical protein
MHLYNTVHEFMLLSYNCHRLPFLSFSIHFTENLIYIFPEIKLRGLAPNSYIHVSVSNLYIPTIGLPICCKLRGIVISKTELYCSVSQFQHSCICERFIYSQDHSSYYAAAK